MREGGRLSTARSKWYPKASRVRVGGRDETGWLKFSCLTVSLLTLEKEERSKERWVMEFGRSSTELSNELAKET